jgi:carboxyl-terminal processing protease
MQDVRMTDSGRTVYGGGGISPDEKYTAPDLNAFQMRILRKSAFFNFTAKYFGTHSADLPKGWAPDQSVLDDFHRFLLDDDIEFTEAEFAENHDWVQKQLRREMYITAFSIDDSQRLAIETDPTIEKAIESLPKAQKLLDTMKEMIAQRRNRSRE